MIWVIKIQPGEDEVVHGSGGKNISLASLDCRVGPRGTRNDELQDDVRSTLLVKYNGRYSVVCTLDRDVVPQQTLDLILRRDESVTLRVEGSETVHLTGYSLSTEEAEVPTDHDVATVNQDDIVERNNPREDTRGREDDVMSAHSHLSGDCHGNADACGDTLMSDTRSQTDCQAHDEDSVEADDDVISVHPSIFGDSVEDENFDELMLSASTPPHTDITVREHNEESAALEDDGMSISSFLSEDHFVDNNSGGATLHTDTPSRTLSAGSTHHREQPEAPECIPKDSGVSHESVSVHGKRNMAGESRETHATRRVRNSSKCKSCKRLFATRETLHQHEYEQHGRRKYLCGNCGARFLSKSHLREHDMIHTGERPFSCGFCGKKFITERAARAHTQTCKESELEVDDNNNTVVPETSSIRVEKRKGHANPSSSNNHSSSASRGPLPLKCNYCGRSFPSASGRERHIRGNHHRGDYLCQFCGVTFKGASRIRTHEMTHTKERPFQCDDCQKYFTQRAHLRVHQRIHTGERPHKCHVCNKDFRQRCHLTAHGRVHTGERPFKCGFCDKAFRTQYKKKSHEQNVHKSR